jgi:ATP-dependent RNA helicase RhlE
MMSFKSFGLNPILLDAVEAAGFTEPTPIQAQAIPPALLGRDVLASAKTGSGKTAAFLLPILQRLLANPRRGATRALIVTPTRELAAQIHSHFALFAGPSGLTAATIFGGVGMEPQVQAFKRNVDVIVATPGRLLDPLRHTYARFGGIEVLVLDEADRMLDMGFLPDVKRILARLPVKRQTLLFSATMPEPIVALTKNILADAVAINIGRVAKPAEGVKHTVFSVEQELKGALFVHLLEKHEMERVLIFTRTRHRADRLAKFIARAGIAAMPIHGGRSQSQRDAALNSFRDGRLRVLVATDIAARGIDVVDLAHVVNYDVPNVPDDYVHRVGRTARAEATGDAFTFVSAAEEADMRTIEKAIGMTLERNRISGPGDPAAHVDMSARPRTAPVSRSHAAAGRSTPSRAGQRTGAHRSGPGSRGAAAPRGSAASPRGNAGPRGTAPPRSSAGPRGTAPPRGTAAPRASAHGKPAPAPRAATAERGSSYGISPPRRPRRSK